MYKSCLDTIFIGKYLTYLPSCHSTNDIATELGKLDHSQEGHVVITDFQSAGRGQRGAKWSSSKGQNLLLSIHLKPDFIPLQNQFTLSMAMALGVYHFLQIYTSSVTVKWPNDIYIGSKKCAGLLIENSIGGNMLKRSTVGIGININQMYFESDKATSLAAITGQQFELANLLCPLLQAIEKQYQMLRYCSFDEVKEQYLQVLLGYRTRRPFRDQNGEFQGKVIDITPEGMLVIEHENQHRICYSLKEVEWL